jgi:hypothetical protein
MAGQVPGTVTPLFAQGVIIMTSYGKSGGQHDVIRFPAERFDYRESKLAGERSS